MADTLDRLKVLINSSTPIVVMETSEEMRAVNMVRTACAELNMASYEWTIADGLVRSGSGASVDPKISTPQAQLTTAWNQASRHLVQPRSPLSPTIGEAERLTQAMMTGTSSGGAAAAAPAGPPWRRARAGGPRRRPSPPRPPLQDGVAPGR